MHRSGIFFLRGKKCLITGSGSTHSLHKISSKTLTSKGYITFALIALLIFLLFTKRQIRVMTALLALLQLSHAEKNQTSGNKVTTHRQKKL